MRLLASITLGLVAMTTAVPSGFAKIFPDDFLINQDYSWMIPGTPPEPVVVEEEPVSDETFFYVAPLEDGRLTRGDVLQAIATRLYDARSHDDCFVELVSSFTVNYSLLFRDVTIESPVASSVCVMMRSGVVRGYRDGTFRPNEFMTVAEASVLLARMSLDKNWLGVGKEPWYKPSMDAIREVDREFTMQPGDIITGRQLKHLFCVLSNRAPLDPLSEFTQECR